MNKLMMPEVEMVVPSHIAQAGRERLAQYQHLRGQGLTDEQARRAIQAGESQAQSRETT